MKDFRATHDYRGAKRFTEELGTFLVEYRHHECALRPYALSRRPRRFTSDITFSH